MRLFQAAWTIARKDLVIEARTDVFDDGGAVERDVELRERRVPDLGLRRPLILVEEEEMQPVAADRTPDRAG